MLSREQTSVGDYSELKEPTNKLMLQVEGLPEALDFDYLNTEAVAKWLGQPIELKEEDILDFVKVGKRGRVPIPKSVEFAVTLPDGQKDNLSYNLTFMIGKGGIGAVYLANLDPEFKKKYPDLDSQIVVKVSSDKNESFIQKRLIRETALHAVLHPSNQARPELSDHLKASQSAGTRSVDPIEQIPDFFGAQVFKDVVSGNQIAAIGLKKIEGKNLRILARESFVNEGEMIKPTDAVRSVHALAKALAEMHARGLIHRDLKPGNIMINKDHPEESVLIDLGLGLDLFRAQYEGVKDSIFEDVKPGSSRSGKEGSVPGTLAYMMPGYVRGEDPDPMIDIYGLALSYLEQMDGIIIHRGGGTANEAVWQIGQEQHLEFYDDEELEQYFPSKLDQKIIKSLYDMVKPVLPEQQWSIRDHFQKNGTIDRVMTGQMQAVINFLSRPPRPAETKLLQILDKITETSKPDQAVKDLLFERLEEYFNQFSPHDIEQQGMFAVVKRLSDLRESVYKEQGMYAENVEQALGQEVQAGPDDQGVEQEEAISKAA